MKYYRIPCRNIDLYRILFSKEIMQLSINETLRRNNIIAFRIKAIEQLSRMFHKKRLNVIHII